MTTKLSEAIRQKELEAIGRKNLMKPLPSVTVTDYITESATDMAYVMSTKVVFQTTATVTMEYNRRSDDSITETKRRMARIIINEVFGEFREDFDALRKSLYNCDFEEAIRIAETFERRMFEV